MLTQKRRKLKGDNEMKKWMAATLICAVFSSGVDAETVGKGASLDKRIRTALYSPDNVYRLSTMKNRTSTIQFPPGETVNRGSGLIATGNPGAWVIGANQDGNMVVVKPDINATDANTNVIINTNKHTYIVELKLTDNPAAMTYLLRFNYPVPPKPEESPFKGRQRNKNPCEGRINRNYQKRGDMSLSPYEIWDNGTFTCLRFPTNAPRPVIYQVLPDGTETLANLRSVNDIMVVHGVSQRFRLRLNRLVLELRTEQNNTGWYNDNGTTTGKVREVKNAGKE
ncbi:conjugative transfer protein [Candidatus Regiella insecticola LSR1]|uniref:Conjugative transfer protein n=2 Tax=Candidatus Regiella insecticola TaxID=138073 RepID=E0WU92_9ENTR|nr:conjugative transfer protein [Candidatus Regiella insecticola LSR1]